MAESSQAFTRKRNYYLQIMQAARQMDDQNLVRIILKRLTDPGLLTGTVPTTFIGKVIPIPTMYALSRTFDREQHISDFLTSQKKRGGDKMDKRVAIIFSLFALLMIGGSLFFSLWIFPNYFLQENVALYDIRTEDYLTIQAYLPSDITNIDSSAKDKITVSGKAMVTQMIIVIGAICAVMLVGLRLNMDKKLVMFFSLFTLLMIGGSLFTCLWIFPKYLLPVDVSLEEIRMEQARMFRSQPTDDLTSMDRGSKDKIMVNWKAITTQMIIAIGAICGILLVGLRLTKKLRQNKPVDVAGYIFKITRVTNKNEYDVFYKAAEDWPVSVEQIENDYQRFVVEQRIPYYVNDFIRKNKKHIDELRIPLFMGDWFYF